MLLGRHTPWMRTTLVCGLLGAAMSPGVAETRLERGDYLVNVVGACGNCHSPVDANGNRNGPALSGGPALLSPAFEAYAPNITSALKTGIGSWSEDQIVVALREGRTPDGHLIRPPMPVPLYRFMSDDDAYAIATYLKTIPPTEHETPVPTYKAPMPTSYGPSVGSVPDPPRGNPIVYGAYLAKLGHCMECHTPIGAGGKRDTANRFGAGGMSIDLAWGSRIADNITSDPETGSTPTARAAETALAGFAAACWSVRPAPGWLGQAAASRIAAPAGVDFHLHGSNSSRRLAG